MVPWRGGKVGTFNHTLKGERLSFVWRIISLGDLGKEISRNDFDFDGDREK
jgi:hypothetical protein